MNGGPLTRILVAGLTALLAVGCGNLATQRDSGPSYSMDARHIPDPVPRHEPRTSAGNPKTYVVLGRRYHVMSSSEGYVERGIASWYGRKFHGRKTSNGETYDMYALTAAHKSLPIPTYARVTNLENGRQVVVRINDRGPFHDNRLIDLSYTAASKLGIVEMGTGLVEVRAITPGEPEPPLQQASVNSAGPNSSTPPVGSGAGDPRLFVQVGAYISRMNAEQVRARLEGEDLPPASVDTTDGGENALYRVRIGPIGSVEEADELAFRVIGLGVGSPRIVVD